MKKICLLILVALTMAPLSFAADNEHAVEFGAFLDYLRLNNVDQNFYGVGGRVGVNPHPNVGLEGEMSYDFERNVAGTTTLFRSGFRTLHGLFGLKLQSNGPIRVFGTAKGGFVNFGISNSGSLVSGFTSAINNVQDGDTKPVFYPGGGIELGGGTFGLRLEVGDFMYFEGGPQHNLRFTVGPQIRF
jgi:hypothetical protein